MSQDDSAPVAPVSAKDFSGVPVSAAANFGLSLEEMAEGRIQEHTKLGLPEVYNTPLTRLIVADAQEQCLPRSMAYARARILLRDRPAEIDKQDVLQRMARRDSCIRAVMQRYQERCHMAVGRFQAAVHAASAAEQSGDEDELRRARWAAQTQQIRLQYCAALNKKQLQSKPIPWYFNNPDGTPFAPHLEEQDE